MRKLVGDSEVPRDVQQREAIIPPDLKGQGEGPSLPEASKGWHPGRRAF